MKHISKILVSVMLAVCVLATSFCMVSAATPVSLMPTAQTQCTINTGDGEVLVADGIVTVTNKADGDLKIIIKGETAFDFAQLHSLHVKFKSDIPFKMAYNLVSKDTTGGWANTLDNYADLFPAEGDLAKAGEFDATMKLSDVMTGIVDKSEVTCQQFVILVRGKGTFTLSAAEMTDGSTTSGDTAATTTTTGAATTTTAAVTTTTVKKADNTTGDSAKTGDVSNAIVFVGVAAAAAGVVALTASKKSKAQ